MLILKSAKSALHYIRCTLSHYRKLPDFIIIGAQKSGTTALFDYLSQHPELKAATSKEVHYFDRNYHKGRRWYLGHFPLRSDKRLSGEASPYYLMHPLVPQRVKNLSPEIKLIVLLRNPITRAFSHYQMECRAKIETLCFKDALNAEEERIKGEEELLIDSREYRSFNHLHFSYKTRGLYARQLKRWFEHYPRENFFIESAERFFNETSDVYSEIIKFLGLEPKELKAYPAKNVGGSAAKIDNSIEAELKAYFEEPNKELYELLGRSFNW